LTESLSGPQAGPGRQGPLPARSATEAHRYLDLHPCECGTARPRGAQELRDGGNGTLTSVHGGTCPACGRRWSIAFSLPASPPPAGVIGGGERSQIIDPGEWLWLSNQDAGFPAGRAPGRAARERLHRAAAEADEAAKFIPEGGDRVPAGAFTSSLGRAVHDAFPGCFSRAALRERARLYRAGAALPPWPRPREPAG
jgi:hypothetical protein